ncbi:MAG: hypothetical protein ABRQ39_20165 [Candidatus Eremiobacterota bacterium]
MENKESKAMIDVLKWREKVNEELSEMTDEERIEYFKNTNKLIEQYGFKFKRITKEKCLL